MRTLMITTALALGTALGAQAQTAATGNPAATAAVDTQSQIIEVAMLNKDEDGNRMVFGQEIIFANVGDTIRFVPTDKSHNAQSVRDAIPEEQEAFRGRINQEVDYVVTETGLTAVICQPHQAMGMVALVVVGGDLSNAEAVLEARIPGQGGDKIEALVAEAREMVESGTAVSASDQNS